MSVLAPTMAKWELVLPDLKVLSRSLQLVCQLEMQLAVLCCGNFDLFFQSVRRQDPVSSTLCFDDEGLQASVAWGVPPADVLSAVARSRCKQRVIFRSSKPCVVMAFAGVPFAYCLFSVFFKLRWTTNNRMKKTTRESFGVILISLCRLVSSCSFIVLPIIFLDMKQIWDTFTVSYSKKQCTGSLN